MGSLKSDVLLKLPEDMKMGDNESADDRKPVLIKIRSVIPVLKEGHSTSHALYVSLPQEQNEMILGNKRKLGQFIYDRNLENAHAVPLIRAVTPVPGRRQCKGTPDDIVSPQNLVKILEASRMDKFRKRILDYGFNIGEEGTKSRPSSVDNDSDTDSIVSYASSTSISKRRSWNESEILGVKDIFDSSVAKHEISSPARSRSANVSGSVDHIR
ncbi:uncharacterized protein [Primulina huaijiensis]|uniref:uncharacterized protein isoform X2 n=1 Tax=Primulina huaijiensis TaxID=1492673 RepID=UPI003CC6E9AF